MPNSHTEVYVHFVWATWDRKPLISAEIETRLYALIRSRCRDMQCHLMAIGGMPNHIHVLVRLPATRSLSQVAQDIKGASAYFVATELLPGSGFKWQGAYAAFGVCMDALDRVIGYIENQKQHHAQNTILPDWERTSE